MKLKEIREMTNEELILKLRENEKELFKSKFQNSSSTIKNPMIIRTLRKDIARIKTLLSERDRQK